MTVMSACPNCGAEVDEDDKFCVRCGSSLASGTNKRGIQEKRYTRDTCFAEGERGRDYFGLVSFGIFLLIVGIVFAANPEIISDFRLWIEQMAAQGALSRPPETLINSGSLFFGLIGVSNFFTAGLRLLVDRARRGVFSDILSGVALVLFAYLIHLYGAYALTWQMVLATEVVAVGLLVILYSIVRYLFPKKMT